ncbi:MAG: prepilin-type N-terminal cleavage/methylation domain-containing protein [Kiritimatiellae bacterium]|nr:prepilin-type N-terminal cleavage/methylation domain-containing protein [Kiritimatiellia bacterium]
MIRSRNALTLIELLVAMGIAVLLAAVVFAIYAGVLRTLDSQGRWRAVAYPSAAALDALSLDLAGAVVPWGMTNPPFVLAPSSKGAGGIRLHFFAARSVQNMTPAQDLSRSARDVRAYAVREIDYSLSTSAAAGTNSLIRAWSAFRMGDPAGIASNVDVWESVRAIRLEVFDGKRWTNTWGTGTNAPLPQAARVMLMVGDESVSRQIASEVLIPAGQPITAPKNKK